MARLLRVILVLGVLEVVSATCSSPACAAPPGYGPDRPPRRTALACGRPTRLKHVSPAVGAGARAGPIWFIPGAASARAIIQLLPRYPDELYPTKVLIFVRQPLRAPITLRGRRCSDGKALRFWYRAEDGEPPGAGSSTQLEQTGDLVAQLQAGEPPITQPALGYPGYMLFFAPGKWKVSARQNGRLVGTVVFRVVAPEPGGV